jgi:hypothetical protein
MKTNTKTATENRDHMEKPWNYEDETRKIYTGQNMAEIIRDAEQTAEAATITDFVRAFLALNTDSKAAIDVFAAAASFRYTVLPKN